MIQIKTYKLTFTVEKQPERIVQRSLHITKRRFDKTFGSQ